MRRRFFVAVAVVFVTLVIASWWLNVAALVDRKGGCAVVVAKTDVA